jgi:hydrogenase maturation protease
MSAGVRVIGLGQRAAGDDGVGLAVVELLRVRGVPSGVEVVDANDTTDLVALLATDARVIVVDAVVAERAGEVLDLAPEDLSRPEDRAVSSHALSVRAAIELARALGDPLAPAIDIVGITIERATRLAEGLSPVVGEAVPRAVEHILARLGG